jgi:hypothetical protein
LQSTISWQATQGTTYYIRVGGFGGAQGDFVLEIEIAGAFTTVGTGCGGSGLTGTSSAGSGLPEIGSTVTMTLAPAAGVAQAIWLGVPQAPVAFCPGCSLCATLTVLLPAGPVAAIPIPNSSSLCGACLSFQGSSIFIPSGAGCSLGGLSFTLSNCVNVLIGC